MRGVELVLRYVLEVDDEAPPPAFHRAIEAHLGPRATEILMSYAEKLREEGRREGHRQGVEEGIQEGMQKGIQKGIQEGMQKGIQKGIQEGIQKGIQEGMQKGMIQGQRTLLLRLAARRFGELPTAACDRIESASPAELQAATDALLVAADLDELLAALDAPSGG